MLSIQDVGTQIMTNNPGKFYIFCGPEYGVKLKYVQYLENYYGEPATFCDSVLAIINLMKGKRLIPLKPTTYVIKYDTEFLSTLNEHTTELIDRLNIVGTVVLFYEKAKHMQKCNKYLENYTVEFNSISSTLLYKYLSTEFPTLPDNVVQFISTCCKDYNKGQILCRSLHCIDEPILFKLTDEDLTTLFDCETASSEAQIRNAVAHKNFRLCISLLDRFELTYDNIYYVILSLLIDIEKHIHNGYCPSECKDFIKLWSIENVYNLYMQTYNQLKLSRTKSIDLYNSVVYLLSLLLYERIPSVGEI